MAALPPRPRRQLSLLDVYLKEEELLADVFERESSFTWQRYGSSLVANTILITAAGLLLSARSTPAVEFALRYITVVLGGIGVILNCIFYWILIRSRAILRVRCRQLREVEHMIKEAIAGNPTNMATYRVWGETEYNDLLKEELAKSHDPREIVTLMTWLPLLFIALFSVIALASLALTYLPACRALCWC